MVSTRRFVYRASGQSKVVKEIPSQDEAIRDLSLAEDTQIALGCQSKVGKEFPSQEEAIPELSPAEEPQIALSPQLSKDDLKAFLEGIQASTSNIHSISTALIKSGAVGGFVRFPKLPPELRFKIWKTCLPSQRIVEFYAKVVDKAGAGQTEANIGIKQAPHVFFRVTREARQIALERYSLQLSKSKYKLANTRIDLKTDFLCLAAKTAAFASLDLSILKHIWSPQAMLLKTIGTTWFKWNMALLEHLLKTFKVADELILFLPDRSGASGGPGEKKIVVRKMEDFLETREDISG
ncbi:hypothetical protein NA56DRAFT_724710 [Hyaloscypha hepaticicola]|uniref:2EXR domain-containing protein n=1 Tax=Hyaloscypha hepaticicola TaxID=2082293 RepID=A0A2J6PYP8_9HELO|nr:hypothetical protein NA56DRAFT_724710 [Hyaloscypha hepaticicola]